MKLGEVKRVIQRSSSTSHLFQLRALVFKTSLDWHPYFISLFVLASSSISLHSTHLFFHTFPTCPPLFSWNTLFRAYTKSNSPLQSLTLLPLFLHLGLLPDNFTYPSLLKACGQSSMLPLGSSLHSLIIRTGFILDLFISNTLLRMYAACTSIALSRQVFDEMPRHDVASWSSLIAAYVSCKFPQDALLVFGGMMKMEEVKPNSVTLVSFLSACTHLLDARTGAAAHTHIVVRDIGLDASLGTALLDMYSKCGFPKTAFRVFNMMEDKNLQSWTLMISCLAHHGHGDAAISLFEQMEFSGMRPDGVLFSVILSMCSHLGLVEAGRKLFDKMVADHGVRPTMEHYGCVVDLLGRAGLVQEATEMVRTMPFPPNAVLLRSFISACSNHGYGFGRPRELLLEADPGVAANYVLAANMCSSSGCWTGAAAARVAMKGKGLKKVTGLSMLDVAGYC